eukprot:g274.t1
MYRIVRAAIAVLFFSASGRAQKTPLLSVPVQFGENTASIDLFEGDNVRAVAGRFLADNGLPQNQLDALVRVISERISSEGNLSVESASGAGEEVSVDVTITVPLSFRIGEPLEDAAARFCAKHGLDAQRFQQVLVDNIREKAAVMDQMQRQQAERVVQATLSVTAEDGRQLSLVHYEGDEVLQSVIKFCVENNLDVDTYQTALANALVNVINAGN